MTNKLTFLDIPNAMKEYAEQHGAVFDKESGWHFLGEVPIALEDFIIKTPRTEGPTWTMQCPKCGSQMKIVEGKNNHLFWGCMRFPHCKGSLSVETPDKPTKNTQSENLAAHHHSTDKAARTELAELALHVLKTPNNIEKWFDSPMIGLGGKKPSMMLSNAKDIAKIRDLLMKLHD